MESALEPVSLTQIQCTNIVIHRRIDKVEHKGTEAVIYFEKPSATKTALMVRYNLKHLCQVVDLEGV